MSVHWSWLAGMKSRNHMSQTDYQTTETVDPKKWDVPLESRCWEKEKAQAVGEFYPLERDPTQLLQLVRAYSRTRLQFKQREVTGSTPWLRWLRLDYPWPSIETSASIQEPQDKFGEFPGSLCPSFQCGLLEEISFFCFLLFLDDF